MIINLENISKKYDLNLKGIIHIGAHYGDEHPVYKKYIQDVIYFEPVPKNFKKLQENVGIDAICVNVALGNETKEIEMYIESANNGQSCSILKPKLHLKQFPHIIFNEKIKVPMIKLDNWELFEEYNFMNIDVQGYELNVLKGSIKILEKIDYIMIEVNKEEVYENCAKIWDIDKFLKQFNFYRIETKWWENSNWGDAFYIKEKI